MGVVKEQVDGWVELTYKSKISGFTYLTAATNWVKKYMRKTLEPGFKCPENALIVYHHIV